MPWLLDDEQLEVADEMLERATDPRTERVDPERWSEEERRRYAGAAAPDFVEGRGGVRTKKRVTGSPQ